MKNLKQISVPSAVIMQVYIIIRNFLLKRGSVCYILTSTCIAQFSSVHARSVFACVITERLKQKHTMTSLDVSKTISSSSVESDFSPIGESFINRPQNSNNQRYWMHFVTKTVCLCWLILWRTNTV